MNRLLLLTLIAVIACAQFAWAAKDKEESYEDSDAIFESIHKTIAPETEASSAEALLEEIYPEADVNEGSYPPSELWDHDLDLRRTKPASWNYSGYAYGKYSKDDTSDTEKWENEYVLNLSYKNWDGYFRVSDFQAFANKTEPVRFDKARMRYRYGDMKVTVGSLGGVFGRGLAVNMLEDKLVDFDNEIEGVKVEYALGKTDLTAIWGTRKDRAQQKQSELTAVRAAFPITKSLSAGVHAVNTKFPDLSYNPSNPLMLDYDLIGGDLTYNRGILNFYGETVRLDRSLEENATESWDQDGRDGKGYYLNLGLTKGNFAISGEYKNYQGLYQPFSVLPPLRRYYEQAKAEPNDDKGYLVSAIYSTGNEDAAFTGTYAQSQPHEMKDPYTELSLTYNSPSSKKTTWVPEYWQVTMNGNKRYIYRLTTNHRVNNDWVATGVFEREHFNPVYSPGYSDYIYEAELAYQSKLSVTFTQEETGLNLQGARTYWKLWELKFKPVENHELNLVVGSRRAGFVCSGGVCRPEPEFEGVRVDYTFRF